MGIFKRKTVVPQEKPLKVEQEDEVIEVTVEPSLDASEVTVADEKDLIQVVRDHCEQILEITKQTEEFRIEYEAVTNYLVDIQKIEMIPADQREDIDEAARKIISLTKEREKYQNGEESISPKEYKILERYENDIPDEVRKISEKESYHKALKKDIRTLENEKQVLIFQRNEAMSKQLSLKKLSVTVCGLVVTLFVLLFVLAYAFESDMTIPFILTVILGMITAFIIFYESRKNSMAARLAQRKMNRAIGLLNRVKIKYINNQCSLDYSYQKFHIKSASQLTTKWSNYMKTKEANEQYKKNTELLNFYNEQLIRELRKYQLNDPEIWIYQAAGLIESKEMVEIRHPLNVRRQKLRERMDSNSDMKKDCMNRIQHLVQGNQHVIGEVKELLKNYKINLS